MNISVIILYTYVDMIVNMISLILVLLSLSVYQQSIDIFGITSMNISGFKMLKAIIT